MTKEKIGDHWKIAKHPELSSYLDGGSLSVQWYSHDSMSKYEFFIQYNIKTGMYDFPVVRYAHGEQSVIKESWKIGEALKFITPILERVVSRKKEMAWVANDIIKVLTKQKFIAEAQSSGI